MTDIVSKARKLEARHLEAVEAIDEIREYFDVPEAKRLGGLIIRKKLHALITQINSEDTTDADDIGYGYCDLIEAAEDVLATIKGSPEESKYLNREWMNPFDYLEAALEGVRAAEEAERERGPSIDPVCMAMDTINLYFNGKACRQLAREALRKLGEMMDHDEVYATTPEPSDEKVIPAFYGDNEHSAECEKNEQVPF